MPDLPQLDPSKVTPSNVMALPQQGNLQSQLAQGQLLVSKLTNPTPGNLMDLLGSGVTMVNAALGGSSMSLPRAMVTVGAAAASGAAVGGPFGAIAGAIVGVGQAIANALSGGPPTFEGFQIDSSAGSERLYTLVAQWQSMNVGVVSGNAKGQSLAEYLVRNRPPGTTARPNLLWFLVNSAQGASGSMTWQWLAQSVPILKDGSEQPMPIVGPAETWPRATWPLDADGQANAKVYAARVAVPVDTSVFWGWAQPSAPAPGATPADYAASFSLESTGSWELWKEDTSAVPADGTHPGMTVDDIMQSALRRAPDPLYFAQELYVAEGDTLDGSESFAMVMNTAAASALASVLGLLAIGGSTEAIVRELMLQQHILDLLDLKGPSPLGSHGTADAIAQLKYDLSSSNLKAAAAAGRPYSPDQIAAMKKELQAYESGNVQPRFPILFRQLVEDYVALAHAEAKDPKATMASVIAARGDTLSDASAYGTFNPSTASSPSPAPKPAPSHAATASTKLPPAPAHPSAQALQQAKATISSFITRYVGH